MTAILGLVTFGQKLESSALESASDAMSHFSAEPCYYSHAEENVIFSARLTRCTPASLHDKQPWRNIASGNIIVSDSRLDCREELADKLYIHQPATTPDSQLILTAYDKWGENCTSHLSGDFVFSIWDSRRKVLFFARDHIGAKSIYYSINEGFAGFASNAEALLKIRGFNRGFNKYVLGGMFIPGYNPGPNKYTWYKNIHALLPGRQITVDGNGKTREQRYWRPTPGNIISLPSESDYHALFWDIFNKAVRDRMDCPKPAALLLSGGIDSATIASSLLANSDATSSRLRSYSTISSNANKCVETQCIRAIADRNFNPRYLSLFALAGVLTPNEIMEAAWERPHPVSNSILLPSVMMKAAAKDGHTIMIHGAGGDITMQTENAYIKEIFKTQGIRAGWLESVSASRNHTYINGQNPAAIFATNFLRLIAPDLIANAAKRIRNSLGHSKTRKSLSEIFPHDKELVDFFSEKLCSFRNNRAISTQYTQCENVGLLSGGLTGYSITGHSHGIETRDPWSDKNVVEFFINLPTTQKIRHGWTKYPARTLVAKTISPEVAWRKGKEHLGYELQRAVVNLSSNYIRHTIENDIASIKPYARIDPYLLAVEKYFNGDTTQCVTLLRLCTIIEWIKRVGHP